MKKILLWLLVLTMCVSMVASFSLVGCKEKAAPAEEAVEEAAPAEEAVAEEEIITITMWYYGEQEAPGLQNWIATAAREFEEKNPNVKVSAVLMGNEEMLTNMNNAGAAKEGPDIGFGYAGSWTMDMIFRGWAAPLSDYWTEDELNTMTQVDVVTWKDKVWCFNLWNGVHPIMYNKKHFDEAGIDIPKTGSFTWEELLDACQKLVAIGKIPLGFGAKWGQSPWFIGNFGIQYLDSTKEIIGLVSGESDFNDSNWLQYHEKVYELNQNGYINKGAVSLEIQQAWDLFASEQASMIWVNGPAVVREYGEAVGGVENVGVLKNLAIYGDGKLADNPLIYPKHLFVTSWSPHKDIAAAFLKTLATEEKMNSLLVDVGIFPCSNMVNPSLIEEGSIEETLLSWVKPDTPIGAEAYMPFEMVSSCLIDPIQALLSGAATPEEASQIAQDGAEKWRNEHPDLIETYIGWGEGQR